MKNNCYYIPYVDSYLHGELDEEARLDFERHLPTCPECGSEIESLTQLKRLVTESYDIRLDERFNYNVISDLRKAKGAGAVREMGIALEDILISLATLLVIAVIIIQVFKRPSVSSAEMVGSLTKIERSSLEQSKLSNDQVLELVVRRK